LKSRLLFLVLILGLLGCNAESNKEINNTISTSTLIANEILKANNEADIFMFENGIYKRVNNSEKVEATVDEKIGEIKQIYTEGAIFSEGMATLLPVGTKIFSSTTGVGYDVLFVEVDGNFQEYHLEAEG
jgi:hypothetical protein